MNEIVKAWLKKSEADLKHAKASFTLKDYDWAQLASQQSAEKALKAVCIMEGFGLLKVHDLTLLGRKVGVPKDVLANCGLLNPFYTGSRYPDMEEMMDEDENRQAAEDSLKAAKVILKWCKNRIKI